MTITPMPVLPAAPRGSAARATDAKQGKAADDFAAVLDGQLNGAKTAPHKASDPKQRAAAKDTAPGEVTSGDAQAGGEQPAAGPTTGLAIASVDALQVAVSATTPAPVTSAPSGAVVAGAAGVAAEGSGSAGVAAEGSGSAPAVPPTSSAATAPTTNDDPATPHQTTAVEPKAQPATATADPAPPHQPAATTEPIAGLAVVTTVTKEPGVKAATAAVAPDQPEPSTAAPAVGVSAPAAPASEAPAAGPTQPTAPSPVLAQVTPALARVVTRGDGEHRMMLKLHPADLGEIHLTVTVRGEHVDVEIAAGAQARDVLRDGSAHLRSMLESIGRSTGQLVLRDLPSTPAQTTHGTALDTGAQQDGRGTSYAGNDDPRRDRSGTGTGRQAPTAERPLDPTVPTRPASPRTTVPGASALDVTV